MDSNYGYVIYSDDLEARLPVGLKSSSLTVGEEGLPLDTRARCTLIQNSNNQLIGNIVDCFFGDTIIVCLEPIEDPTFGMLCVRMLEKVILEHAGEEILLEPVGPVDFYYDTADPIFRKLVWVKFSVGAD